MPNPVTYTDRYEPAPAGFDDKRPSAKRVQVYKAGVQQQTIPNCHSGSFTPPHRSGSSPGGMPDRAGLVHELSGNEVGYVRAQRYKYQAGQALAVAVDLPSRGTVSVASPKQPYLGLIMDLDFAQMQRVAEEIGSSTQVSSKSKARGAFFLELNEQLLSCAQRAIRLLETPEAAPVLYAGIMREICYWLLTGPRGAQIRDLMVIANGQDQRVVQAIHTLRDKLNKGVNVENLALAANMSLATFHRHFKAITGMAPI